MRALTDAPAPPVPAPVSAARSDLPPRTLAAAALIALLAGALLADRYLLKLDVCFQLLLAGFSVWGYLEFAALCRARGMEIFPAVGVAACLAMIALTWLSLPGALAEPLSGQWLQLAGAAAVLAVFLRQALRSDQREALPAAALTLLGVLYLWFLPSFLVRIRHLGGREWLSVGTGLLVATVAVCKIGDMAAYLVGRRWGRTRLAPRISPGKSVEGSAAGLAASAAAALALGAAGLLPSLGAALAAAFGLAAGLAGQCGDLVESLLKRSAGLKDSGRLMPGYGGCLDVVDSLVLCAPVAYLFLGLAGAGWR